MHGWGGNPKGNWFQWLKKELEARNVIVEIPAMPNTEAPEIEHWVNHLAKCVDAEDENILIGHSMGCQAILRYLEKKPEGVKVSGAILVAGFITSLSDVITSNPQEMEIAKPWLETPIDLEKIKTQAGKFVSILSDNDQYIPEDNWEAFRKLGEIIILHGKGHIQEQQEPRILEAAEKLL